MHVGRRLAYVHVPKTGGSWTREVLRRLDGAEPVGESHGRAVDLPAEARAGRMVVATLREPRPWYASLWGHIMRAGSETLPRQSLRQWTGGDESFEAALWAWTHPWRVSDRPDRVAPLLHPRSGAHDAIWQTGRGAGWGLYSSWFAWALGRHELTGWAVDALLDMDDLAGGLSTLLGISPSTIRRVTADRNAVGAPKPAWTPAMRSWVAVSDTRGPWGWAPVRLVAGCA